MQADWHFLRRAACFFPVQDLSHHARAIRIPARFETKVNVVFVCLIEKLPAGNRAPHSGRDWLQIGIEEKAKARVSLRAHGSHKLALR